MLEFERRRGRSWYDDRVEGGRLYERRQAGRDREEMAEMGDSPYTCTFCGCLCDDLELVVESNRLVDARNACGIGRSRLIGLSTINAKRSVPLILGRPSTIDEALTESARLLVASRSPAIVGFLRSTNETMREAVALADRLGAVIEVGDSESAWPRISAMQRRGAISATLGEVKNRADVVVFWGTDPVQTHPRHLSRYSVDVRGRFMRAGRAGRKVVVVDRAKTRTAERADLFVQLQPEQELNALNVLLALVRGVSLEPSRVESAVGCAFDDLKELADQLRNARYGAWFSGPLVGRGAAEQAEAVHQATTALIRELNRTTKFVAVGMGEGGNAHGAESVLAWQSGFTPAVDFGAGYPESLPVETSAVGRIERGEFDGVIVVGGDVLDRMSSKSRALIESRPWLFLGDPEHEAFGRASVAFPTATAGIDESGTFTRVDGVALPVRAFQDSEARSEGAWLEAIRSKVTARKGAADA